MAHNTLHVIGARCVARDFHTIVPWPLQRTCWRQFVAQRGDCKKSRTAPLNAIIIIINRWGLVGWLVGCLTSQQHASVSQGRICTDNFTCCHTEIEAADQTFYLTQSQYTDTGPTSPSADPITPGAWQGSHWSANV